MRIPEKFSQAILSHVITASIVLESSLVLAVQGPPGSGKSFQVRECLRAQGIQPVIISGSSLSGKTEAASRAAFDKLEHDCFQLVADQKAGHVVAVIEDFDLSPAGRRGDDRHTVNSQLLVGHIMNLGDIDGSFMLPTGFRAPIIVTGNNFQLLHGPLTRAGRMNIFTWEPSREERLVMAESVLERLGIDEDRDVLLRILDDHPHATIAEFAGAVNAAISDMLWKFVSTNGPLDLEKTRKHFQDGNRPSLRQIGEQLQTSLAGQRTLRDFVTPVLEGGGHGHAR